MNFIFGDFHFDPNRRALCRGDAKISLAPKTSDLLLILLQNAGKVLTRQQLLEQLWSGVFVVEEVLTFQVSELRKALGDQGGLVRTVRGEGYKWDGEATAMATPAPSSNNVAEAASSEASPDLPPEAQGEPESEESSSTGKRGFWLLSAFIVAVIFALAIFLIIRNQNMADNSDWVQVFADDFDRWEVGSDYQVSSGRWMIASRGLQGEGSGFVNIDLVPHFAGQVKIQFDVVMPPESAKREVAVFLHHDLQSIQDGYYAGAGSDHDVASIDRNGTEVKIAMMPEIQAGHSYHITVVRRSNQFSMSMDGKKIVSYLDPIPLHPNQNAIVRIGTYDGILRIDNLRIYRARVPELSQPIEVGDRLFDRGQYDVAQIEYEQVMHDHSEKAIAGEALAKVGVCLIAKKKFDEAEEVFRRVKASPANEFYRDLARLSIGKAMSEAGALDDAFRYFAGLEAEALDEDLRYGIANEINQLISLFIGSGRSDRGLEAAQFIIDHFTNLPLLTERAALKLAANQPDDEKCRQALQEFLRTYKRIGKPRYEAENLLGLMQFMQGDWEAALELYRRMEKEFTGINPRFSICGIYCQALTLSTAGRNQEAEAIADRMRRQLGGDPLPEQLFTEWQAFDAWQKGDHDGAIEILGRELQRPHGTIQEAALDQIDLSLMCIDAGKTLQARELLLELTESEIGGVPQTASLMLGLTKVENYLSDEKVPRQIKYLYAGEYHALEGRTLEAAGLYVRAVRAGDWHLLPAFCRAYIHLHRTRKG